MEKVVSIVCPLAGTNDCKGHKFSVGGNDLGCANRYGCCCNQYENGCDMINRKHTKIIMRCPLFDILYEGHSCDLYPDRVCGFTGMREVV